MRQVKCDARMSHSRGPDQEALRIGRYWKSDRIDAHVLEVALDGDALHTTLTERS